MSVEHLTRHAATDDRRGFLRLLVGAVMSAPRPAQALALPDCKWVVHEERPNGSCGGCTTGGLACFGKNACDRGCVFEEIRDYCGALRAGPKSCCEACDNPCQPNIPCREMPADDCPRHPGTRYDCEYYARKNDCTNGNCKYYSITSPKYCTNTPPTLSDASDIELSCIRRCLQIADARNERRTAGGCSCNTAIVEYHDACFEACGFTELRFPEVIFRVREENDGDC